MIDDMSLRVHEVEPSDNHRDHVAEAVVIGTAITRFHRTRAAPTRSLSILPLRPGAGRGARRNREMR